MLDEYFSLPKRRHVRELNIVPILDMLTTIIFFLLLSTSFLEYNKVTLPPSGVATITDPVAPPPLRSRLTLLKEGAEYRMIWSWAGAEAGMKTQKISPEGAPEVAHALAALFKAQHPEERTLQIGMGRELPYQDLIALMDAVRPYFPDVVLYSYQEAEAETKLLPAPGP